MVSDTMIHLRREGFSDIDLNLQTLLKNMNVIYENRSDPNRTNT